MLTYVMMANKVMHVALSLCVALSVMAISCPGTHET